MQWAVSSYVKTFRTQALLVFFNERDALGVFLPLGSNARVSNTLRLWASAAYFLRLSVSVGWCCRVGSWRRIRSRPAREPRPLARHGDSPSSSLMEGGRERGDGDVAKKKTTETLNLTTDRKSEIPTYRGWPKPEFTVVRGWGFVGQASLLASGWHSSCPPVPGLSALEAVARSVNNPSDAPMMESGVSKR